jgi:transposase InsO family protein
MEDDGEWLSYLPDRLYALHRQPAQPPATNLCFLNGIVNDHPVNVLLDCGASRIYASKDFVDKLRLELRSPNDSVNIRLPNGSMVPLYGTSTFTLRIGSYSVQIEARVLDLPDIDIILGLEWLRSTNPFIDWSTLEIRVQDDKGHWHTIRKPDEHRTIDSSALESVNTITGAQARRALRKRDTQAWLYFVQPASTERQTNTNTPDNESLPTCTDPQINDIIRRFSHIFRQTLPDGPPPQRTITHPIDTGDAKPININAYPLPPTHQDEQYRQVMTLLEKQLVRPSSSPWGFPVLFVKKKDGEWRMCIDYRALNAITKRNGYPLPRIQECLDRLAKARYLTKIDLTSGYWQVQIDPVDVPKTAFNTRFGKFEFIAMPFGLSNAPATFQTLMNSILQPFLDKFVMVYLDDILIYSETIDDHRNHVEAVLQALSDNKLIAKPSKCMFAVTELEFCGHVVGNGVLRPCRDKLAVIRDWPRPSNVHEVRQFLGLASYYRRFVKGFAAIAGPLFELLKESDEEIRRKKHRPVGWTASCEYAFTALKERLTSEPVLAQPDVSRPFSIETDASDFAIGCTLLQDSATDGKPHPVAFDGKRLTNAEIKYPTHEKELLAIKHALRTWRCYIDNGCTTTIFTDHESLKYLRSTKVPSRRLARWVDEFAEYDLDIRYRPGKYAVVPDAISRRPDFIGFLQSAPSSEWADYMEEFLRSGKTPTDDEKLSEKLKSERPNFVMIDDVLHRKIDEAGTAPYVPFLFRADIIERMHNEYGHLGYPGLDGVLRYRAWWPSLEHDVRAYVSYCPNCQTSQRQRPNQETEHAQHLASKKIQPFERWGIDLIGQLPTTPNGNKWIITAIDYATGWPVAKAVPDAKQETVADFLHNDIFANYGAPREILSDNGPNLLGGVIENYLAKLRSRHRTTTPYHPRTNGKVENLNGTLGSMLTKYLMGKPTRLWDQYLTQALFATRVRVHATSKYSPFYLLYGCQPFRPTDDVAAKPLDLSVSPEDVAQRLEALQHARLRANEAIYMRALNAGRIRNTLVKKHEFQPGDYVLVRHEGPQKFEAKWYGPYKIAKISPLGTYQLLDPKGKPLANLINGQRLIRANITGNVDKLWTSPFMKAGLRKAGIEVAPPSKEVQQILDDDGPVPPTYDELATVERQNKRPSTKSRPAPADSQANLSPQTAMPHTAAPPAEIVAPQSVHSQVLPAAPQTQAQPRASPMVVRSQPASQQSVPAHSAPQRIVSKRTVMKRSLPPSNVTTVPTDNSTGLPLSSDNHHHEDMVPSQVGEEDQVRTTKYNLRKRSKKTAPSH